jgi:hypothetical protein
VLMFFGVSGWSALCCAEINPNKGGRGLGVMKEVVVSVCLRSADHSSELSHAESHRQNLRKIEAPRNQFERAPAKDDRQK